MKLTLKSKRFLIALVILSIVNSSFQVNLTICKGNKAISLVDSNGNELKKLCDVVALKNYVQAQQKCRQNGMELVAIENEREFAAFSEFLMTNIPGSSQWSDSQGVWINGLKAGGGWYTYAPDQKTLNVNALKWTSSSGDCLTVKRQTEFKVAGFNCNKPYRFVCQFDVAPVYIPPIIVTTQPPPQCPEPIILDCEDFKAERDRYKNEANKCAKELLDAKQELDGARNVDNGGRAIIDQNFRALVSKAAKLEVENEELKRKAARCQQ